MSYCRISQPYVYYFFIFHVDARLLTSQENFAPYRKLSRLERLSKTCQDIQQHQRFEADTFECLFGTLPLL
jgi:hypothetical protein